MWAFFLCLRENIKSAARSASFLLALIVSVAFVVAITLAYPAYLSYKERSTETPPWSADLNFTSRGRKQVNMLAREISTMYGGATVIDSCQTESFVSTDPEVMNDASGAKLELVPSFLLNDPEQSVFPVDVYIPESLVISGNPREGDGLLVDSRIAEELRISAGSKLYIGMRFPEDSAHSQSVAIGEDRQDVVNDVVFLEKTVSSIVMPSSLFEGIALFQPAENVQAYEKDGEASCTQLYVLGPSQEEISSTWNKLAKDGSMEGVYLRPASEEVQWATDLYAQDKGGIKVFMASALTGFAAIFLLIVLDGIRRQLKQKDFFSVLLMLGAEKKLVVRSYSLSSCVLYGAVVFLGSIAGLAIAHECYPIWIPPEIMTRVVCCICIVTALAVSAQIASLAILVGRMSVSDSVLGERD